jgi:hypothetical protein
MAVLCEICLKIGRQVSGERYEGRLIFLKMRSENRKPRRNHVTCEILPEGGGPLVASAAANRGADAALTTAARNRWHTAYRPLKLAKASLAGKLACLGHHETSPIK